MVRLRPSDRCDQALARVIFHSGILQGWPGDSPGRPLARAINTHGIACRGVSAEAEPMGPSAQAWGCRPGDHGSPPNGHQVPARGQPASGWAPLLKREPPSRRRRMAGYPFRPPSVPPSRRLFDASLPCLARQTEPFRNLGASPSGNCVRQLRLARGQPSATPDHQPSSAGAARGLQGRQ